MTPRPRLSIASSLLFGFMIAVVYGCSNDGGPAGTTGSGGTTGTGGRGGSGGGQGGGAGGGAGGATDAGMDVPATDAADASDTGTPDTRETGGGVGGAGGADAGVDRGTGTGGTSGDGGLGPRRCCQGADPKRCTCSALTCDVGETMVQSCSPMTAGACVTGETSVTDCKSSTNGCENVASGCLCLDGITGSISTCNATSVATGAMEQGICCSGSLSCSCVSYVCRYNATANYCYCGTRADAMTNVPSGSAVATCP